MKLKAGRWYEDREDRMHGPVAILPKGDHRYEGGMRFICGKLTWGKRGNYWYDGYKHSCDLIWEVHAPSECRGVDHLYPGGVAPARPVDEDMQHRDFHKEGARLVRSVSSPEGDKDLIARLLDAAQLTPVRQIGDTRVAPPLVPKAIKRKKWGKWIKGPCMDWRAILQVEYGESGETTRRHRIKNPRE